MNYFTDQWRLLLSTSTQTHSQAAESKGKKNLVTGSVQGHSLHYLEGGL